MAIYARLENGTYAEVTGVYKTDGTEITEIFQGERLVYSATNEIYGAVPLYYDGKGYDLTDYLISGNTVQDGTPSPDAPVDATGCGVRTEQLFEDKIIRCNIDGAGKLIINPDFDMYIAKVEQGVIYTASERITGGFYTAKPVIGSVSYNGQRVAFAPETITAPITGYMAFRVNSGSNKQMLNLGSTALPYEPYGFKLSPTVNGVEYPIYLGTVPTTRRIKKLVLTGEETVRKDTNIGRSARYYIAVSGIERDTTNLLSSHFTYSPWYEPGTMKGYVNTVYFSMERSQYPEIADFKSYLAAQYTNGTPVTVWYVLAEPETGIVNEPLMKIGDYADTVSFAQSGVAIPTVNGANVLDMASPVKPSEVYIKGKGIKQNRGQS